MMMIFPPQRSRLKIVRAHFSVKSKLDNISVHVEAAQLSHCGAQNSHRHNEHMTVTSQIWPVFKGMDFLVSSKQRTDSAAPGHLHLELKTIIVKGLSRLSALQMTTETRTSALQFKSSLGSILQRPPAKFPERIFLK
ncbi:uncharacterized protein LOC143274085 isoform X1 [Peromyscus maniculatus bairdii]|uniref:uncharacterized protein LOC143274085 isoform X1 n=1 Tax=Peromyscus maniculatus bairdii TaxID=230844 RepID=UPI003FD67C38